MGGVWCAEEATRRQGFDTQCPCTLGFGAFVAVVVLISVSPSMVAATGGHWIGLGQPLGRLLCPVTGSFLLAC